MKLFNLDEKEPKNMITYYFVEEDGLLISEETAQKGYFSKDTNPDMFISRKAAIKEAIKQLKRKSKEINHQITEYEKEINNR